MTPDNVKLTARAWFDKLAPFRRAHNGRAMFEFFLTLGLYAAVVGGMYAGVMAEFYWVLLGLPLGALLVVRLFIIQHY